MSAIIPLEKKTTERGGFEPPVAISRYSGLANRRTKPGYATSPEGGLRYDFGGGRIRTHEALASLTVFKTAAFDHSATPPSGLSDNRKMRL